MVHGAYIYIRITEALVFCPVPTPVVVRKKGEIIIGRASTVGGQWLVKIASAWVTKGFQAGERGSLGAVPPPG